MGDMIYTAFATKPISNKAALNMMMVVVRPDNVICNVRNIKSGTATPTIKRHCLLDT